MNELYTTYENNIKYLEGAIEGKLLSEMTDEELDIVCYLAQESFFNALDPQEFDEI